MIPLALADIGSKNIIKKILGNTETKKHLTNLGFVHGGEITVISILAGNIIVNVKESRIAISKELAQKIII